MHQTGMSTSDEGNGTDMGIRATFGPLFDRYEVDLVLHGHEHDYERSYPVRGFDAASSRRPQEATCFWHAPRLNCRAPIMYIM